VLDISSQASNSQPVLYVRSGLNEWLGTSQYTIAASVGRVGFKKIFNATHYIPANKLDYLVIDFIGIHNFEQMNPPCLTCLVRPSCIREIKHTEKGQFVENSIRVTVCDEMLQFIRKKQNEYEKRWRKK
jgi:hypothetical protein